MSNVIVPSYHVVNREDRWSIDLRLNDEELVRCFNFEDTELRSKAEDSPFLADTRLRAFQNDSKMLEFNRYCIMNDVRRALWSAKEYGERFMHSHPFGFSDLLFVRYDRMFVSDNQERLRFDRCVLA